MPPACSPSSRASWKYPLVLALYDLQELTESLHRVSPGLQGSWPYSGARKLLGLTSVMKFHKIFLGTDQIVIT